MLEFIINFIISLISNLGYPIVFTLMFLDALNVPAASEITLLFSGFLVYSGRFNFQTALLIAVSANLLGGITNYFLGRLGQKLFLSKKKVERGKKFIEEHFNYAPFLGNVLPFLRSFIALPLGLVRYPLKRFVVQAVLAYFIWSFTFINIGRFLADKWETVVPYLKILDFVALAVIIGVIIYVYKYKKAHRFQLEDEPNDKKPGY